MGMIRNGEGVPLPQPTKGSRASEPAENVFSAYCATAFQASVLLVEIFIVN